MDLERRKLRQLGAVPRELAVYEDLDNPGFLELNSKAKTKHTFCPDTVIRFNVLANL